MSIKDLVRRKKDTSGAAEESNPFALLRTEMNRLMDNFDSFWTDLPSFGALSSAQRSFLPNVEVSETEKAVQVSAELPGMTEKDIEVTLSADASMLTIKGEKKSEQESKEKNFHRYERSYGSFQRSVALPCAIDDKGVEANFQDGVLSMVLPKLPQEAQGIKKIAVKGK